MWLSGLASLLNYATYPLLARILPDNQFVNITVALSLLTQMSTFLSSIVAVTIGLSKQKDTQESLKIIERLQAVLMKLFLLLVIVFIAVSPILLAKLRLPLIFVVPICLLMLFSIPTSVISGYLNGKNKLIKLGLVTMIIAFFQFIFTISVGIMTKNASLSLSAMAIGQLVSIGFIYHLYRTENLPSLRTAFGDKTLDKQSGAMRKLIVYTAFCSLAIMAVNILQISDLLIIKSQQASDVKLYTDLYIISRVVFFAGTVFIWPFLGAIDIHRRQKNVIPLIKVIGLFCALALGAIVVLGLGGTRITSLLFGSHYTSHEIQHIGVLAILYKLIFLILTTLTLYLIVIRSYLAVVVPMLLSIAVAIYSLVLPADASTTSILTTLSAFSLLALLVCSALVAVSHHQAKPRTI